MQSQSAHPAARRHKHPWWPLLFAWWALLLDDPPPCPLWVEDPRGVKAVLGVKTCWECARPTVGVPLIDCDSLGAPPPM